MFFMYTVAVGLLLSVMPMWCAEDDKSNNIKITITANVETEPRLLYVGQKDLSIFKTLFHSVDTKDNEPFFIVTDYKSENPMADYKNVLKRRNKQYLSLAEEGAVAKLAEEMVNEKQRQFLLNEVKDRMGEYQNLSAEEQFKVLDKVRTAFESLKKCTHLPLRFFVKNQGDKQVFKDTGEELVSLPVKELPFVFSICLGFSRLPSKSLRGVEKIFFDYPNYYPEDREELLRKRFLAKNEHGDIVQGEDGYFKLPKKESGTFTFMPSFKQFLFGSMLAGTFGGLYAVYKKYGTSEGVGESVTEKLFGAVHYVYQDIINRISALIPAQK